MKFFMYSMYVENKDNPSQPFDTFIGITAATKADAERQLIDLVGEAKAEKFDLYDILDC